MKEKLGKFRSTQYGVLFLVSIVLINASTGCHILSDTYNENQESATLSSYSFDSTTILDTLERGDEVVFTLIQDDSETTSPPLNKPVLFSQTDYIEIAQAFIEKIWEEPYEELKLFNVVLTVNCSSVSEAKFNSSELQYYRLIKSDVEKTRGEFYIDIIPERNIIIALRKNFKSTSAVVAPIDWRRYQIPAEEALQIAEMNGGAENRLKFDDDCRITVLTSGTEEIGWNVSYKKYNDGWWNLFYEIVIDPLTGESNVLFPKSQ